MDPSSKDLPASGASLFKKSFKKSSLRHSFGPGDLKPEADIDAESSVVKATKRKPKVASRLSFGGPQTTDADAESDGVITPRRATLGRRPAGNSALQSTEGVDRGEADDERPRYSKTYLEELRSSTPSKPAASLQSGDEQGAEDVDISLDPTELEGATIVTNADSEQSYIPSALEVAEKKARRARLAHEQEFISLSDGVTNGSSSQLSLLPRKKKTEPRLVREDEDFAEGFDEFVSDGRISLGKKQERAERRSKRAEMAELIKDAEGHDGGSSSDDNEDSSDRERLEAYEHAQVGRGMDGLRQHRDRHDRAAGLAGVMPTKITPLPVFSECLARFRSTVADLERDLQIQRPRAAELQKEKAELAEREAAVQGLLEDAGRRFAAIKGQTGGQLSKMGTARQIADEHAQSQRPVMRGLESFGEAPQVQPGVLDMG